MNASAAVIESDNQTANIDISTLQCHVTRTRIRMWMPSTRFGIREPQQIIKQVQCGTRVTYRVFRENRPPLDMCNQHFNEYFERRNVDASMVMRLSDDEEDFVPSARRKSKKK